VSRQRLRGSQESAKGFELSPSLLLFSFYQIANVGLIRLSGKLFGAIAVSLFVMGGFLLTTQRAFLPTKVPWLKGGSIGC
jgi:hypothetical protein